MAITIDYSDPAQYIINIPKTDMTLIQTTPTEIRQLNINDFRITLNDLMDDEDGMWAVTNHIHTPPLIVSGVTLARVVEILEPYVIQFEDLLYNVNIVGGNSNISDKVIKNQVGVNTANSAGLQDPFALQAAAYGPAKVTIDQSASTSGTSFPFGTRAFPVNNLADAIVIATLRGIGRLSFVGNYTFLATDSVSLYEIEGQSTGASTLTFPAGSQTIGTEFYNCSISGTLVSPRSFFECRFLTVTGNTIGIAGTIIIKNCGFEDTVTLSSSLVGEMHLINCFSAIAGGMNRAIFDINGAEVDVLARGWSGGMQISNLSNASSGAISLDFASGDLTLDNSCTTGTIKLRGNGEWLNESTYSGTSTVSNSLIGLPTIQTTVKTIDIDGVTFQEYAEASLAVMAGKMVITENGVGDVTIEFMGQDGTTTFVTGRVVDGVRTEGNVNEENM